MPFKKKRPVVDSDEEQLMSEDDTVVHGKATASSIESPKTQIATKSKDKKAQATPENKTGPIVKGKKPTIEDRDHELDSVRDESASDAIPQDEDHSQAPTDESDKVPAPRGGEKGKKGGRGKKQTTEKSAPTGAEGMHDEAGPSGAAAKPVKVSLFRVSV